VIPRVRTTISASAISTAFRPSASVGRCRVLAELRQGCGGGTERRSVTVEEVRGALVRDHRLRTCFCWAAQVKDFVSVVLVGADGRSVVVRPPPRMIDGLFDLGIQGGAAPRPWAAT
jgi:hypothetical protein